MEATWEIKSSARTGVGYAHVYLNNNLRERWWAKTPKSALEPLMCLTGCGWMIRRAYYFALGGFDERLGTYGGDGVDWGLKIWLHPEHAGQLLLASNVVCGHLFGSNKGNKLYPIRMLLDDEYHRILIGTYGWDAILSLVRKFWPVPSWTEDDFARGLDIPERTVFYA